MSADGYEYIFDITNTDDNGKNILFDFTSEEDDTSLGLDLTTNEVSDTESTLEGTLEISSNGMNLALMKKTAMISQSRKSKLRTANEMAYR